MVDPPGAVGVERAPRAAERCVGHVRGPEAEGGVAP